jgi:preprotein translocase subunit YajC
MYNTWMLADATAQQAPDRITSEPVTSGHQTTSSTAADANAAARQAPPKSPWMQFLPLILLIVVMFFMFRGPQKKQQQQRKMIAGLEKNDKVRTIGGIIGTVVDIKEDEITLKVDEATNAKIKVISSAIGKNLTKEKD